MSESLMLTGVNFEQALAPIAASYSIPTNWECGWA